MKTGSSEELRSRQQIRDFAHTLDAASFILRELGFPLHKLRDVVDGLQGAAGGRREFELSFLALARRLRHAGKAETAETYAQRKVKALDAAQRRCGRMLFTIKRGGGIEHKRTTYVDHLTAAANWMMQRARESDLWAANPGRAIESFVAAAIEMLPLAPAEDEAEHDPMPIEDDLYIQRMINQGINYALKGCERAAELGRDPAAVARMAAERLMRYAEGVQKCTPPAEDAGEPLEGYKNVPLPVETPEIPATDAALGYARGGCPVFPVRADKTPHTARGFKDATTDEEAIRSWWRRWPDAGIGIPTGEASGLLVIDSDPRHGGDAALCELIEAHGPLPDTLEAETGGGGHHIVFQYPEGSNIRNSSGRLGEGLDVRGEGGYIVAAPTLHASGKRYRWRNDYAPAPAPAWLLERLTAPPSVAARGRRKLTHRPKAAQGRAK